MSLAIGHFPRDTGRSELKNSLLMRMSFQAKLDALLQKDQNNFFLLEKIICVEGLLVLHSKAQKMKRILKLTKFLFL